MRLKAKIGSYRMHVDARGPRWDNIGLGVLFNSFALERDEWGNPDPSRWRGWYLSAFLGPLGMIDFGVRRFRPRLHVDDIEIEQIDVAEADRVIVEAQARAGKAVQR